MQRIQSSILALGLVALLALAASCTKKEEQPETQQRDAGQETISFVSEDVSFGIYFDEAGTQRSLRLDAGRQEFTAYLILDCPEHTQVASVEWRLELPAGVEIVNDRYRWDRTMSLGTIEHGISEGFKECLEGPRLLLHTLTFLATAELSNATVSVMPSLNGNFLGIAECREGFPMVRAASYRAVINPATR